MVYSRFVLLVAVLLASTHLSAATTIDLGPTDWRRWGSGTSQHSTEGLRTSVGQTVRMPPVSNRFPAVRNPTIPYQSIGNAMRTIGRGTPQAVLVSTSISTLFYAMDWFLDTDTGQWSKSEEIAVDPIDGTGWFIQDGTVSCTGGPYPSPTSACDYAASCNQRISGTVETHPAGNLYRRCLLSPGSLTLTLQTSGLTCPPDTDYNSSLGICVATLPVVLTDSDYQELTDSLPGRVPELVGGAAGDSMEHFNGPLDGYQDGDISGPTSTSGPETTSTTINESGDTIVTNTNTTYNHSYGPTTITTTTTNTTNTYTNGQQTSSTTETTTPGESVDDTASAGSDWPLFCEWAVVVCDFIDWFKEPFDAPDVEWPVIEDQDFEEEYSFSLSAQCPEPYTINLALFPPVSFSWQPFCDLAAMIKPLIIASAALFAAFIALGISRGRT